MRIFGIDQETWIFINTFGPWLSGIGTLLVAALSIRVAKENRELLRPKLKVDVFVWEDEAKSDEDSRVYAHVEVINIGHTVIQVEQIFWALGASLFRPEIDNNLSSAVESRLESAQKAAFFIPINQRSNWSRALLRRVRRSLISLLKNRAPDTEILVVTTTEEFFRGKAPEVLISIMESNYSSVSEL